MTGYHVLGDWGTTRLRLFRIEDGAVVDRRFGPGIGALAGSAEGALREALEPWFAGARPERITLGGMVGSRNGWHEVPYLDCPAGPAGWSRAATRLTLDGIPVALAAGLACAGQDGAPDVMRGEETQIFGALASEPALATGRHLIALPGTHGKWARLDDGVVTGFRTFLTGELFALLCTHSTLLRTGGHADQDEDEDGFDTGLARAAAGRDLLGALFEARAAQLRDGRTVGWAQGFLSGLLIGSEVGKMIRTEPMDEIVLIGDPVLVARYVRALRRFGRDARTLDGDRCVLAGLDLMETAR